jgi:hypothetical protein
VLGTSSWLTCGDIGLFLFPGFPGNGGSAAA